MVRRLSALLVPAIAVVGFALPSAQAGHCNGDVTDLGGVAYIDDRGVDGGTWVYVESNGTPGLQSGGESVILGADDADDCAHENPDTLIV